MARRPFAATMAKRFTPRTGQFRVKATRSGVPAHLVHCACPLDRHLDACSKGLGK